MKKLIVLDLEFDRVKDCPHRSIKRKKCHFPGLPQPSNPLAPYCKLNGNARLIRCDKLNGRKKHESKSKIKFKAKFKVKKILG